MAPAQGKTHWFFGTGLSMDPLISSKSILRTVNCCSSEILPSHLVVYCAKNTHVCHRVLLRERRGEHFWFFLSGNHPLRADGWIPDYRIVGKVYEIDGKDPYRGWLKWKVLFFHWHGLFEIVFIHKVFGSRLAKFLHVHFGWRNSAYLSAFLKFSSLSHRALRKVQ